MVFGVQNDQFFRISRQSSARIRSYDRRHVTCHTLIIQKIIHERKTDKVTQDGMSKQQSGWSQNVQEQSRREGKKEVSGGVKSADGDDGVDDD